MERLSCVEAGMVGVWTCVYCDGAWLERTKARALLATAPAVATTAMASEDRAPDAAALVCPRCRIPALVPKMLGDCEVFVCRCEGTFLPKAAVSELCNELGGRPWQLGELLLAGLGARGPTRTADAAFTAGALLVLLFT
jgi:Zn-finger nucleic acid-binding protein